MGPATGAAASVQPECAELSHCVIVAVAGTVPFTEYAMEPPQVVLVLALGEYVKVPLDWSDRVSAALFAVNDVSATPFAPVAPPISPRMESDTTRGVPATQ